MVFSFARSKISNLGTPSEVKVAPEHENSLCIYSTLLGEGNNFITRLNTVKRKVMEPIDRNGRNNHRID